MRWMVVVAGLLVGACVATDSRPHSGYCSPTEVMNKEPCPDTRDVPRLGYQPG